MVFGLYACEINVKSMFIGFLASVTIAENPLGSEFTIDNN
ncbi:hypothetical protein BCL52_2489 [Salisediminibacterium halotolerans]|nr:hypothetical protein BCL39_2494 [Actinophytocola xinjiangensis]RPE89688.1 hypothetical protein EDD67_0465 [Salisediminibacterium halotolerans]TWG32524.1 hypothetical protein BCL52_2489 [Salisediminibacterium halotolerans]GEL09223.1 hypothetical protein SHA02_26390 [Salisediminibacterium halotolerans]